MRVLWCGMDFWMAALQSYWQSCLIIRVMRRSVILIALHVVGALWMSNAVFASANVSKSFETTDPGIVPGSLVSARTDSRDSVELANTSTGQRLVGVAVSSNQSLLAIDAASNKVQVAISGTADVLVSTLGGDIRTGDQVAVSPISGIGMKAGSAMRSIGVAQGDFTAATPGATTRDIKDKNGLTNRIQIGRVSVAIIIGYASAPQAAQGIIGGVQSFASSLAGHTVTPLQAAVSFVIAIIAIAALVSLIYGAIHGSLISIGRNPLARVSIYRSLAQIVLMALMIMVIAVVIVYLALR